MANKDNFDINEMAIFVEVVNAQSFTGAANNLGLPKSTISRKITQLEEHLGVRLLQRTTRTLRLTDSGSAYFNHCARIMADIKEANVAITQMQSTPSGTIRLTAPVLFGSTVLTQLITEFLGEHPQINIDMMLTDQVVDIVQEGCDLAFRVGDLADSSMIARQLGEASRMLVATPEYLEKNGVPEVPHDLENHHAITYSQLKSWDLQKSDGSSVNVNINARVISTDIHSVHQFVLSGLGIGWVPTMLCADDLKAGKLKPVLCSWTYGTMPIHVLYPSNRHLSAKVRAFVEFIVERIRKDTPWDVSLDNNMCNES